MNKHPLLLAVLPALLLGTASAAPSISAQSIIVNPVVSALKLSVWTDRDPSGQNTPIYRGGEKIRIFVTPSQNAYVYLFNVGADGAVTQILPNRFASEALVKANTVKSFPGAADKFTFDIAGPAGVNKVLALASRTALNLSQLSSFKTSQDTFATVAVRGQERLAQALSIVVNPVKADAWVTDTAQYAVAPAVVAQPVPIPVRPAPVRPAPLPPVIATPLPAPAWTSRSDWRSEFTSQDSLATVYNRYVRELQAQGYRLLSSRNTGNPMTANFGGRGQAELTVKQKGKSGKYEVRIDRRSENGRDGEND